MPNGPHDWPEKDLVIAMTSGLLDLQSVLDVVWDTLLPDDAWLGRATAAPRAPDPADAVGPSRTALRPPAGAASTPWEEPSRGVIYELEPNPRDVSTLTLGRDASGRIEVGCTVCCTPWVQRAGPDQRRQPLAVPRTHQHCGRRPSTASRASVPA